MNFISSKFFKTEYNIEFNKNELIELDENNYNSLFSILKNKIFELLLNDFIINNSIKEDDSWENVKKKQKRKINFSHSNYVQNNQGKIINKDENKGDKLNTDNNKNLVKNNEENNKKM